MSITVNGQATVSRGTHVTTQSISRPTSGGGRTTSFQPPTQQPTPSQQPTTPPTTNEPVYTSPLFNRPVTANELNNWRNTQIVGQTDVQREAQLVKSGIVPYTQASAPTKQYLSNERTQENLIVQSGAATRKEPIPPDTFAKPRTGVTLTIFGPSSSEGLKNIGSAGRAISKFSESNGIAQDVAFTGMFGQKPGRYIVGAIGSTMQRTETQPTKQLIEFGTGLAIGGAAGYGTRASASALGAVALRSSGSKAIGVGVQRGVTYGLVGLGAGLAATEVRSSSPQNFPLESSVGGLIGGTVGYRAAPASALERVPLKVSNPTQGVADAIFARFNKPTVITVKPVDTGFVDFTIPKGEPNTGFSPLPRSRSLVGDLNFPQRVSPEIYAAAIRQGRTVSTPRTIFSSSGLKTPSRSVPTSDVVFGRSSGINPVTGSVEFTQPSSGQVLVSAPLPSRSSFRSQRFDLSATRFTGSASDSRFASGIATRNAGGSLSGVSSRSRSVFDISGRSSSFTRAPSGRGGSSAFFSGLSLGGSRFSSSRSSPTSSSSSLFASSLSSSQATGFDTSFSPAQDSSSLSRYNSRSSLSFGLIGSSVASKSLFGEKQGFPEFGGGSGSGSGLFKRGKPGRSRYASSLTALSLGIRNRGKKRVGGYTGLELRGL